MKWSLLALLVVVVACARPPVRLEGEFPRTTVLDAQQADHTGERVRWGGVIVETKPGHDETCFQVMSAPLDRRARPRAYDDTSGRFEACAPGFYEPEVYGPRREVTVVGTIREMRHGKVGEYEYVFPHVAAEAVYLWPDRNDVARGYYGYGYPDPYYYPYGYPYYGYPYYGYGPYWEWGWGWRDWGGWRDGGRHFDGHGHEGGHDGGRGGGQGGGHGHGGGGGRH